MSNASEQLIQMTRLREPDAQGTSGGVRDRVYSKNFKWDGKGGEITEGENRHSYLVTTSLAPTARMGATASLEGDFVFGLNDGPFSDFLSSAGPEAEVSLTELELAAVNAATHEDGSGGPAFVGSPGDLSAFLGREDYLLVSDGWPLGAETNALPRAIKNVWQDGSQIDLDPAYVTGPAGGFGAPLVDAAAGVTEISLTIGITETVGDTNSIPWVSYEGINPDIGLHQLLVGGGCTKWQFKAVGKEKITESFDYQFRDFLAPTASSAGAGVNELPEARNDHMTGLQVEYAALGGSSQFFQETLVASEWTGTAPMTVQDPAQGAESAFSVQRSGDLGIKGKFNLYHAFDTTMLLSQLSRAGHQLPFDHCIKDLDGNRTFHHFPRVAIPARAIPASGKGDWNWTAAAGRWSGRRVIVVRQKFPASIAP